MAVLYGWIALFVLFFFFQAEDGIRDVAVTGVQTCALPICRRERARTTVRALDPCRRLRRRTDCRRIAGRTAGEADTARAGHRHGSTRTIFPAGAEFIAQPDRRPLQRAARASGKRPTRSCCPNG